MTRSLPRIRPLWQVALLVYVGGVGSAALRPAGAKAGPYEAPVEAAAGEVEVEVDIVDFVAPPAVAVPVVDPPQADADDGLNDQARAFLQQQRPMYESKLTGHLYALRHLCNPTREQQELLLERTFAALGKALRAHAKRMAGVQFFMGNAFAGQQQKQPWDVVKAELEEAIGECLSAEQLALYQDDVRQREAFRRQASATNLVSAIDKQLNLTEEQREAIQASLLADWQESWEASIRGLMYSPVYLPQLPNRLINPHLSAKQKKIWSKTQRQGPVIFGDDGFMGHGVLNLLPFRAQDQRPAVDPAELDASGQEPPAQRSKT